MKTNTPRTWPWLLAISLIATVFVSVTGWLVASPSDDISRALSANGKNVQKASADEFLDAFVSVIVTVDQKESSAYVDAATRLRPDLKTQIAATAHEVDSGPSGNASDNNASGHQRKCKICCDHTEIVLPCRIARHYLQTHHECRRGPCH